MTLMCTSKKNDLVCTELCGCNSNNVCQNQIKEQLAMNVSDVEDDQSDDSDEDVQL